MSFSKVKIILFWRRIKNVCSSFIFFKKSKKKDSQEDLDKRLVYSLSPKKIPDSKQLKHLGKFLSSKETLLIRLCLLIFFISFVFFAYSFVSRKMIKLPKQGGVYTEAFVGYPKNINPIYASSREVDNDISSLIYSSLFKYNTNGVLEGDLVEYFEIREGGKEYFLKIKEGVKWHDEGYLGVDDIVFTFNLINDENFLSPLRNNFDNVKIEKIDDFSLKFILDKPYAPFTSLLTFGILPKYLWENSDPASIVLLELNLMPIGSGPFKFKSILKTKNGEIREYLLEANKDYYNGEPYLKKIKFIFYPDRQEAVKALNDKHVLALNNLSISQRNNLLAKNSLSIKDLVQPQTNSLFFNSNKVEALKDKNFRVALSQAINKKEIVDDLFLSSYQVADSPYLTQSPAFNNESERVAFSASASKEFLKDKNVKLEITVVDIASNVLVVEKIKEYWENAGLSVEIKSVSGEQIMDIIKNRDFEVLFYGQLIGADPDIYSFWHSSQIDKGLNLAGYKNETVDQLLTEARVEVDNNERMKMYQEVDDLINSDLPAIFIYSPSYSYVQVKELNGFSGSVLIGPSARFSDVNKWYLKTKKKINW